MNKAANAYENLIEVDDAQAREVDDALVAFKNLVQNGKDILVRGKDPHQFNRYWSAYQKFEESGSVHPGKARARIAAR